MEFYHVYTEGLEKGGLFYCVHDFVYGMNLIPKCLNLSGAKVLAFCLMDNHVHFVMEGSRDSCIGFIMRYKKALCSHISRTRKEKVSMNAGIKLVEDKNYLLGVIAYVLRNPVSAGYGSIPQDYKWSSAGLYFRDHHACLSHALSSISNLTVREQRKLLSCRSLFPNDWNISKEGTIDPVHYTEVATVENLFSSVKRFMYFISLNKDLEMNISMNESDMIRLSDSELRAHAIDECVKEFRSKDLRSLEVGERLFIARFLRRRFGASFKQIGRVVFLDAGYISRMI